MSPRVVAALDRLAEEYAALRGQGSHVEGRVAEIVDQFESILRDQVDHKLVREAWRDYFLGIGARPLLSPGEVQQARRDRRAADHHLDG